MCKRWPPRRGHAQDVRGCPTCMPAPKVAPGNTGSEQWLTRWHGHVTAQEQFNMGEEKCGPGTEGCRDRRARTRAPLRFTAERGDHEQIKQNKVPNPTSQRLNQGQVWDRRPSLLMILGLQAVPHLSILRQARCLLPKVLEERSTPASNPLHALSERLLGAATLYPTAQTLWPGLGGSAGVTGSQWLSPEDLPQLPRH